MANVEIFISILSAMVTLFLFLYVVDWRYFRDWTVVYLFKACLDFVWGSPVVSLKLLEYPVRLLPQYYNTCILFELWVFPVSCILYNQVTRKQGLWPILYHAAFFSAAITAIEYPIELYTDLIEYLNWSWFTSFCTIFITFLCSRTFIAFFRWGCEYFPNKYK